MNVRSDRALALFATFKRLAGTSRGGSQRWILWLLYPLCFILCFFVFVYWTFPYDRLKEFVLQQIASREPGLHLEIESLKPWWVTGIHAKNVRLTIPSDTPDAPPHVVHLDDVWASASLPSLVLRRPRIKLTAALGGGTLRAVHRTRDDKAQVRVSFEDIDLRRLGLIGAALGVPTRGWIDGVFDLTLAEDPKDIEGKIDLQISKLVIGDGKHKVKLPGMGDGLTVEPLEAGELIIDIDIQEGQATIEKIQGRGADLQLDITGTAQLARDLAKTRLNLAISARATDAYKKKSDRTQALFDLLEMNPAVKRARNPDGSLNYRITGAGTNIRSLPAGGPAPRP